MSESNQQPSSELDNWLVSSKWFNLWRRYPFEPRRRAYIRGTVFMIAILILSGFTAYTISHALNQSTLYGRRIFRRSTFTPQPHIFTNHCDSAMRPGTDENAFASLITVRQRCDNGWGGSIQQISDCIPAWYKIDRSYTRETSMFNDFFAVPGKTDRCLAFECPSCSNENLNWYNTTVSLSFPPFNGTSIWSPDVANLVGTTAIWPWNNVSNPKNGRHPLTLERGYTPADAVRSAPFLARNGTHIFAVSTYTESGFSVSNTFSDFIGLPNKWDTYVTYGAVFISPARQDSDILPGDASFDLRRYMWPQWDASEDYTASTLPLIVGSIGGLFAAFTGTLAVIFGTSVGFVFFGSKPISINPLLKIGENKASERLFNHYIKPYLKPDMEITAEARRNAVAAYLADFIIDTGELNFNPTRRQRHVSSGEDAHLEEQELIYQPLAADPRKER